MRVHRSAYRHGVKGPDIHHAVEHAFAEIELDEQRLLVLGPDRAANLLEVVVVEGEHDVIAIHAMKMRRQFARWLPPSTPRSEQ